MTPSLSRTPFLAVLAGAALVSTAHAAVGRSTDLTARLETARSLRQSVTGLGTFRLEDQDSKTPWRLYADGFIEQDEAFQARSKRTEATAALQEFFGEIQYRDFSIRLGRQAVRWSDSWALPSLDVFSGRRWNRLFADPISEQLTHPTGILTSYATADIEANIFFALDPAVSFFPSPLPEETKPDTTQLGLRIKGRFNGFDLAAVGVRLDQTRNLLGGNLSYAWAHVVGRLEAGLTNQEETFVTVGADLSPALDAIGLTEATLTFMPQLTHYDSGASDLGATGTLGYFPLRWSYRTHTAELALYRELDRSLPDSWFSSSYRYAFDKWNTELSAYYQNYSGAPGRLFYLYKELLGGWTAGVRAEYKMSYRKDSDE